METEDLARAICRAVGRVLPFPWQKDAVPPPAEAAVLAVEALTNHADMLEAALSREAGWMPISEAKRDGTAYEVYGLHEQDDPPGAQRGIEKGDHFWAIALFDVWRDAASGGQEWVFSLNGKPLWGKPLMFRYLTIPEVMDAKSD